jgi:hypothetical protein
MKLQDHINSTDFDMTEENVKAFFLGVLCAEKPLAFEKAMAELLLDDPDAAGTLAAPLRETWEALKKNTRSELGKMFSDEADLIAFMEMARDQLDYFLTGMALSGTNVDNCKDLVLRELIDELEDSVEDLDDFLSDSEPADDGEDFKEFLLGTWNEFALKRSN